MEVRLEQVLLNVRKLESGCWEWLGPWYKNGRGCIRTETGEVDAARAMWIAVYGPLAKQRGIHFRCRNKECVNPAHMYLWNPTKRMVRENKQELFTP